MRNPISELIDAAHNDTIVPASPEPPQHPQTQSAPQVISDITATAPKPFTAPPGPPTAPPSMISRGRQRIVSSIIQESIEAGGFKSSMFNAFQSTFETQHNLDLVLQDKMRNPMSFLAYMQGDTMYLHQSMAQEYSGDFVDAVVKEVNGHVDNSHWKLVSIDSVSEDTDILPSVCSMQKKINLVTNDITKYKARLNVHGGRQTFVENYFDT